MCAIIEILLKKEYWTEEEENKLESHMKENGFLVYVETKRKIELNGNQYHPILEQDEQYALLTCDTQTSGECLCSVTSNRMKETIQSLLLFANEVHYDASADLNQDKQLFWEAKQEVSLTEREYDWSPKMFPMERIKIK